MKAHADDGLLGHVELPAEIPAVLIRSPGNGTMLSVSAVAYADLQDELRALRGECAELRAARPVAPQPATQQPARAPGPPPMPANALRPVLHPAAGMPAMGMPTAQDYTQ